MPIFPVSNPSLVTHPVHRPPDAAQNITGAHVDYVRLVSMGFDHFLFYPRTYVAEFDQMFGWHFAN